MNYLAITYTIDDSIPSINEWLNDIYYCFHKVGMKWADSYDIMFMNFYHMYNTTSFHNQKRSLNVFHLGIDLFMDNNRIIYGTNTCEMNTYFIALLMYDLYQNQENTLNLENLDLMHNINVIVEMLTKSEFLFDENMLYKLLLLITDTTDLVDNIDYIKTMEYHRHKQYVDFMKLSVIGYIFYPWKEHKDHVYALKKETCTMGDIDVNVEMVEYIRTYIMPILQSVRKYNEELYEMLNKLSNKNLNRWMTNTFLLEPSMPKQYIKFDISKKKSWYSKFKSLFSFTTKNK
jgi:hypothetical protein